jgi:hypothetical protein
MVALGGKKANFSATSEMLRRTKSNPSAWFPFCDIINYNRGSTTPYDDLKMTEFHDFKGLCQIMRPIGF